MKVSLGDVFWIKIESEFIHPVVVIELMEDDFAKIVGITTNMKKLKMPGTILLDPNEANLEKQSIIEPYKSFNVKIAELKDFIGALSKERVEEIKKNILFIDRTFFRI